MCESLRIGLHMLERERAHDRLRAAGMRLTPQRRAVIDVLSGDTTHPTAEEVAGKVTAVMPGVSLSTVYKVLHELVDLGLIRSVEFQGAMRFDPDSEDHIHVLCDDCGRMYDATLTTEAVEAIARSAGVSPTAMSRVDVVVRGACAKCVE